MGYCYERTIHGGMRLCCDKCGKSGGVRKRTCPHKVDHRDGTKPLPYCYPAALCSPCYAAEKKTLHATCAADAAQRQAEIDAHRARLEQGEWAVSSGWGSWADWVPEGWTGVIFRNINGDEQKWIVPADQYNPGSKRYLSDYPDAEEVVAVLL